MELVVASAVAWAPVIAVVSAVVVVPVAVVLPARWVAGGGWEPAAGGGWEPAAGGGWEPATGGGWEPATGTAAVVAGSVVTDRAMAAMRAVAAVGTRKGASGCMSLRFSFGPPGDCHEAYLWMR